jgi:hypothetical protein
MHRLALMRFAFATCGVHVRAQPADFDRLLDLTSAYLLE